MEMNSCYIHVHLQCTRLLTQSQQNGKLQVIQLSEILQLSLNHQPGSGGRKRETHVKNVDLKAGEGRYVQLYSTKSNLIELKVIVYERAIIYVLFLQLPSEEVVDPKLHVKSTLVN